MILRLENCSSEVTYDKKIGLRESWFCIHWCRTGKYDRIRRFMSMISLSVLSKGDEALVVNRTGNFPARFHCQYPSRELDHSRLWLKTYWLHSTSRLVHFTSHRLRSGAHPSNTNIPSSRAGIRCWRGPTM